MEGKCKLCNTDTELIEAITADGIVSVCEKCIDRNRFPLLRKQKSDKDSNRELQNIVTRNIKKRSYGDLVDNFHWHIQQARRFKKISPKQLSESIAEPEIIITMAEKAELPEDYEKLIIKLEQYLGVRLFKEKRVDGMWASKDKIDLERANFKEVTVGDLKKIHEEKDEETESSAEQQKKPGFFSRFFGKNKQETKADISEEPAKPL